MLYSVFFAVVYIFNSLVFGAVFSVINVSTLSAPYLPPILTLGVSLLLASKAAFDLNSIVIELGFILKAVYNHSLIGLYRLHLLY